jgi:hypothetical protein
MGECVNFKLWLISDVYEAIPLDTLTKEERDHLISSRWVDKWKGTSVKSRLVCRGFSEQVIDKDDTFASTPLLTTLRMLLTIGLSRGWNFYTGDISTAFLHAALEEGGRIIVRPPDDMQDELGPIAWRLKKAMYGLRTAPRTWQDHFADIVTSQLGLRRSKVDPNLYFHPEKKMYLIVHVDDILIACKDKKSNGTLLPD